MSKLIVVTGGAGFIGSHLCERLAKEGHRVISLDNYFAGSRDNHVAGVEYREGHTKDIAKHIPEKPDLIFHLGEYSRVEQSVLEPEVVHDLNIEGTKGVVAYWQDRRCKLVYAGSSTKFGNADWEKGAVPYVVTKAQNTEFVREVGEQEKLPYAITYFYNVYGPRERAGVYGTVVEAFKQMYLSGAPLAVTSPGTQERNFTHVDDIVDALLLVAERGQGDEYGLGAERRYTILELAKLFGGEVVMLPPRSASRMSSALDTTKIRALGWQTKRSLEEYVGAFVASHARGRAREKRVLVFSTTFVPTTGPAEEALIALMRQMPDVQFDIVTTAFFKGTTDVASPLANAHVYRVGFGHPVDKFLLPVLGLVQALALHGKHRYLFAWSIMASYAALAGVLLKVFTGLPLLITLADQRLSRLSLPARFLFKTMLRSADQVYGMDAGHEAHAAALSGRSLARSSLGEGDAFTNQLRYAYAQTLAVAPAPRPKVLIFSLGYFPKHVGGAEVAIKEITDRIPDIEFHLLANRYDSTLPAVEQVGNVLVYRTGIATKNPGMADLRRFPLHLNKYVYQLAGYLKARELHRANRYDGIWAMMAHSCGIPAGLFKQAFPDVKYLLTLQEGDPPEAIERMMRPVAGLFRQGFMRADALQAISTFLLNWGRRMGVTGEAVVIPNGVDTARFAAPQDPAKVEAYRAQLGKKDGDVYLVTTSRLVHKNAIDDVIRALPQLPERVSFLIYGTGPDEAMLRTLAEELGVSSRTRFMGQIGHAEMPLMLSACDIFIRPSRSEGMGNSFVEAMAAGLPVIATQEGGIADFLFDAKRNQDKEPTGWAVDKDAPEQIAAAVTDILAHPEQVARTVAHAREMVRERYGWDLIAKDMRALFRKLGI